MLPDSPICPAWCEVHGPRNDEGWDVHPAATTRVCRRAVVVPVGDGTTPAEISLERYVAVEDGQLVVEPPVLRVNGSPMTPAEALAIADALRTLARQAQTQSSAMAAA